MDPDSSIVSYTPDQTSDHEEMSEWNPDGHGLVSGLLGQNVVLLGGALLMGRALSEQGVLSWEPEVLLLLLMSLSVVWMLWFILRDSKRPGSRPHLDHHAGGVAALLVLVLFAGLSVLLCVFRLGLDVTMRHCKPPEQLATPVIEIMFLCLQTYLLWVHSKDCIHIHKVITRAGLMLVLSTDLLLWFNAVTDDTIHLEIELDKQDGHKSETISSNFDSDPSCRCSSDPTCDIFQKSFEVLFPFSVEYYLMSACMIYILWQNVTRIVSPHHHEENKVSLKSILKGRIIYGLVFGGFVLAAGVIILFLYQVWVRQSHLRLTAFVLFYGYHLVVMPVMSLCSVVGLLVHRLERRATKGGHNPTRSLDVLLLSVTALGQLALSYLSLAAAFAIGAEGVLGQLDLTYSLLSLVELVLQNVFMIEGLHKHPNIKKKPKRSMFKLKRKSTESEERQTVVKPLNGKPAPPVDPNQGQKKTWTKRLKQEICIFLVICNVVLWIIPAFGAHPQFESGLGKQFFGFSVWFVVMNVGQPLSVFYRMHSVAALMELFVTAT
ncbi:unnamed protein product [Knipowitschia caucasica]|uniref:Otopetrin 3 n=1 Tax=Knipowitschia caucasica TaxID=637954 RepID=A0AAV2LF83_KNICA